MLLRRSHKVCRFKKMEKNCDIITSYCADLTPDLSIWAGLASLHLSGSSVRWEAPSPYT